MPECNPCRSPMLRESEIRNKELIKQVTEFTWQASYKLQPLGLEVTGSTFTTFPHPRFGGWSTGVNLSIVPEINPKFYHQIDLDRRMGTVYGNDLITLAMKNEIPAPYVDLQYITNFDGISTGEQDDPGIPEYGETTTVEIAKLLKDGKVDPNGTIVQICKEVGLSEIATTKGNLVSPDPLSVVAILEADKIGLAKNILEIGCGVSPITVYAAGHGIPVTVVDNSPEVVEQLRNRFPKNKYPYINPVLADAREFLKSSHESYDFANLGLPYELLPDIMVDFGEDLLTHLKLLVIQSGMPGLGQMEHDIMLGKEYLEDSPWYRQEMSVGNYFPYVREGLCLYQYGVIAGVNPKSVEKLATSMEKSGRFITPPPVEEIII